MTVSCLHSGGTRLTTPFGHTYALFGLCGMARESYHPHQCIYSLPSSCMWSPRALNTEQFPSLATGYINLPNYCHTLLICCLFVIIWLQCQESQLAEISSSSLPIQHTCNKHNIITKQEFSKSREILLGMK